jgi:hypothetical protein
MTGKVAGWARLGAKLLMIEMLLLGGTLLALVVLLARQFSPAAPRRTA